MEPGCLPGRMDFNRITSPLVKGGKEGGFNRVMKQIITILLILVCFGVKAQTANELSNDLIKLQLRLDTLRSKHENKYCKERGHVWTATEKTETIVAPPAYIEDCDSVSYMVYPSGISYRKTCMRCKTDSVWSKAPVKEIIWKQE